MFISCPKLVRVKTVGFECEKDWRSISSRYGRSSMWISPPSESTKMIDWANFAFQVDTDGPQGGYQPLQKCGFWEEGTLRSGIEEGCILWGTFSLLGEMKSKCIRIYIVQKGPQCGYQPLQSWLCSEMEDFVSEKISFKKEHLHFQGKWRANVFVSMKNKRDLLY